MGPLLVGRAERACAAEAGRRRSLLRARAEERPHLGGALEHPEASHAWGTFGLPAPPRDGGWIPDLWGGWTCCVEQGHYGHPARKATWLYVVGMEEPPPPLTWGPSSSCKLDAGYHSAEERRRAVKTGVCQRLSKRQRLITPPAFATLMLGLARLTRAPMPF